ncbi:LOW QUALITY PROTEIN: hypothetical protein HID58_072791, partial [Brassica napus]
TKCLSTFNLENGWIKELILRVIRCLKYFLEVLMHLFNLRVVKKITKKEKLCCVRQREARVVARHLFLYGFKGNYYFWTSHGEKFNDVGESSGANHSTGEEEMLETPIWNAYEDHQQNIPEGESVVNAQLVDNTVLKTFMMLNCETFAPYERMFEEYMTQSIPDITPVAMQKAKDTNFAEWCKDYDDRRDQVAESSLLRVETHVVDDVSDYDLARFVFLSFLTLKMCSRWFCTDELNKSTWNTSCVSSYAFGCYWTRCLPCWVSSYASWCYWSRSKPCCFLISFQQLPMTLNAMLNSPARLSHHISILISRMELYGKITSSSLNVGFCHSLVSVTDVCYRLRFGIDPCIHAFIRAIGKDTRWVLGRVGIRCLRKGRIPGGKRLCKISTGSLNLMIWSTAQASGEPPSYTALVRETHSRPDGTFVDYRAEELVTQAEMEATQLSNTEGSPGSPKGIYVYGLGSEQFREHAPSSRVPNGIARNLDLEMCVGGLETTLQSVTSDVAGVKQDVSDMRQDFAATRKAINQLLQTLRPPQAPTGQTSDHQAQAPTGQPNPPNGI